MAKLPQDKIHNLIQKRGRVKASLTNLERYLVKVKENFINTQHDYIMLLDRYESLPPLLEKFKNLHEQIEAEDDTQCDEGETFQDRYYHARADFKLLIKQYKQFELEKDDNVI